MKATAEFLVEPFAEGRLGPHVTAALDAFRDFGLDVEVGPFGNSVTGESTLIASAIEAAMRRSVDAGATRFTFDFRVDR